MKTRDFYPRVKPAAPPKVEGPKEFWDYFTNVLTQIARKEAGEDDLITCPKCGGLIRFTVASNGHTRGACITTEKCFSWIQ